MQIQRRIRDASLTVTKGFPPTGNTSVSDPIDLGANYSFPESVEVEIAWPNLSQVADTKRIIYTLQDSADNVTWSSGVTAYSVAGGLLPPSGPGTGLGVLAGSIRLKLPQAVKRYIRFQTALEAGSSDPQGNSSTMSLLF